MTYDKPLEWQEGEYTVYRNYHWTAPGCHNACGQIVYVKNGKIVKVEGDPDDPYSQGRMCARCLNLPEAYYNEHRVKYPMKRAGERGENKWERISWDEAYDIIVEHVKDIWENYGSQSIVAMQGTGRNIIWQTPFFAFSALKTPNFALGFLSGDSCMLPRNSAQAFVMGDPTIVDMGQQFEAGMDDPRWECPKCIIIWGNNPLVSNGDGFLGHWIVEAMKRGAELVTVDPELTWLAAHSKYWLNIRPGTDGALALAMLNVIINENLYDAEWTEKWTFGFDELVERVQEYPPAKVAEICGIPKEKIVGAARFYATAKPASIQWGLAIDMHPHGVPTAQAITIMTGITGNLDVPGGNLIVRQCYNIDAGYRTGWGLLDKKLQDIILVQDESHSLSITGSASPDAVLEAIESEKPYPVKMLFLQTTNPIANMGAEAPRVYEAMKKVPFNVVVDYVVTPTAVACADIFLPCAMGHERNSFRNWWFPLRSIRQLTQYYECKSDETIIVELGRRLDKELYDSLGIYDDVTLIDWVFHNSPRPGLIWPEYYRGGFDELKEDYCSYHEWPYRKYEKGLLREGMDGFSTVTGQMEIHSLVYEHMGIDPLPNWDEAPESPVSTPLLAQEYPLVLTTGQRSWAFFHSENRQLPTMREIHPDPRVTINTKLAERMGISEGDWVWIENRRGRCKQRAQLSDYLREDVVRAEHGWWFPEKKGDELFRVFDSNINNLTTMCVIGESSYGAPYKCTLCKIYKVTPENSKVLPTEQVTKMGGFGYEKQ